MTQRQPVNGLPPEDFDALENNLFAAARKLSKQQLLELADGLHDELRRRRGPGGGPATDPTAVRSFRPLRSI